MLSACAPHASLSVGGMAEIGNSLESVRLAAFARTISFTLAGHSPDHDGCYPPWQAAQRLRGAGDMPAHVSVLWSPPQWPHVSLFEQIKLTFEALGDSAACVVAFYQLKIAS